VKLDCGLANLSLFAVEKSLCDDMAIYLSSVPLSRAKNTTAGLLELKG